MCLFVIDVLAMDGESCVCAWIGRGCFALALMGCVGFLVDVVEVMVGCCLVDLGQIPGFGTIHSQEQDMISIKYCIIIGL